MLLLDKMRTLAMADATLRAALFNPTNNTFRWFDTQLNPGYINQGTCVSVRQVSTVPLYSMQGQLASEMARVQIDVRDLNSVTAKNVAADICDWLAGVSFNDLSPFESPATSSRDGQNIKLNQRSSQDFNVQPTPAWVETLDYRILNDQKN